MIFAKPPPDQMMREHVSYDVVQDLSHVTFDLRNKESGRILSVTYDIADELALLEARKKAHRELTKQMRERGERWDDYEYPV